MTGVHPSTLRAWERRYRLLCPHRTLAGHRLYSKGDVERVRRVARLAAEGIPYTRIPEFLNQSESPAPCCMSGGPELSAISRERLERNVSTFDAAGLEELYRQAVGIFSFEEAFSRIFLPYLVELGDRWEAGDNVVAEEHFLSAFVRRKVSARMNSLGSQPAPPRVICAIGPDDPHELGLLFFALELTSRGIPVAYLGAATPAGSLLQAVRTTGVSAVCLSVTMVEPAAQVAHLVADLRALPGAPAVIVGGQGATALGVRSHDGLFVVGTDTEAGLSETLSLSAGV